VFQPADYGQWIFSRSGYDSFRIAIDRNFQ
jgi:hypothetical protein